jgi:hypothetical protein
MKNLLVLFLFLCIAASSSAQWQPEVRLTNDPSTSLTSFGNARCIATEGDVIHVVWYDGYTVGVGNWNIFYKRSTDRGLTWSANVNLSNNQSSISYNPAIAVSGFYVHVAWYDNQDGNFEEHYIRSTDGGMTWNSKIRLANNTASSLHRSIAASGSNVHFVWFDNRDNNDEIYYKNSTDGGDTWSADVRLSNTAGESYNPAVAVSGSVVHVAWQDSTAGNWEIYYKRSTNGGTSWGADTRLTNNSAISNFPTLAVSGSTVHIAWVDYRNGAGNIYYKRSVNGGANWGADTRLTKSNDQNYWPSLAVNGSVVHLVYARIVKTGYEIIYNISNNDGIKWGTDVQLTSNPAKSSVPSIAVSGSNIHIIFRDDRDGNYEIYYKRYIGTSIPKSIPTIAQDEGNPTAFQLMQNYPNPFNPSTIIRWQAPVSSKQTLKVYDLLGNEVATLVDDYRDAGSYEVEFNTKDYYLASGIYLYRIEAGDFIQTKMMILMK